MDPLEASALGGAASAFVAALGYLSKTRHERRRATRTALYYLLEMHHVVHRIRLALRGLESELTRELIRSFNSRGISISDLEASIALKAAMPYFAKFGRVQLEEMVSESSDAFSKSLADLAREDPVLAFRLRGIDQSTLLRQRLEEFAERHVEDSVPEVSSMDLSLFDELFSDVALEGLRSAIRRTAWGCDAYTHFATLLLLRTSNEDEIGKELKSVIAQVVESFVSAAVSNGRAESAL